MSKNYMLFVIIYVQSPWAHIRLAVSPDVGAVCQGGGDGAAGMFSVFLPHGIILSGSPWSASRGSKG